MPSEEPCPGLPNNEIIKQQLSQICRCSEKNCVMGLLNNYSVTTLLAGSNLECQYLIKLVEKNPLPVFC